MIYAPFAYIGPGAGFAFLGSFLALVLSVLAGIASILLWPFRMLWRLIRRPDNARARRVVVIRLDGLSADCLTKTVATPLHRFAIQDTSRGPFWTSLMRNGVECTAIDWPGTWPPSDSATRMLSGPPQAEGGKRYPLLKGEGVFHGEIRIAGEAVAFQITDVEETPLLQIQGASHPLIPGEQTVWIRVRSGKTRAIIRFSLLPSGEDFLLYGTPVQIDPEHPSQPISHPASYAIYLARLLGPFWTSATIGDDSGLLDKDALHAQVQSILLEREAIFFNAVEHLEHGLVACAFDVRDCPDFAAPLINKVLPKQDAVLVVTEDAIFSSVPIDPAPGSLVDAVERLIGFTGR